MNIINNAFSSTLLAVAAEVADPTPAIVLSAGCDSNALLLALINTGHIPTVFTFSLDDRTSRDSLGAQENARRLGLEAHLVRVPSEPLSLGQTAREVIADGVTGKANIEVLTPMRFLADAVAAAGCRTLLTGIQADCHFGVTRKEIIRFKDAPVAEFDEHRRTYFATKAARQCAWIADYGTAIGVEVIFPYVDQRVCDVFLGHDWHELNKPRQKEAIRSFPGLDLLDVDKVRSNIQLGDSGVAATLARLVDNPLVNPWGYRSVVGIYNRWAAAHAA